MHSKKTSTKEMKMFFENWRFHNIIREGDEDERSPLDKLGPLNVGAGQHELAPHFPDQPRPEGKEAREKDLILDALEIIKDFSNDVRSSRGDVSTFILETDNGISDHLFIKTKSTMWRLGPESDFPEQVDQVDLGPRPKFHVPSEIIDVVRTTKGEPERGVEVPGAVGAPSTEQGVEMVVNPQAARAARRRQQSRPLVGPMREGLGDEPDLGYQGHDVGYFDDLLEVVNEASDIDKKIVNAAEDVAGSIDELEEVLTTVDFDVPEVPRDYRLGGGLRHDRLKGLFKQFKVRYMTIIGLRQQWFNMAHRYNDIYNKIKIYLSSEARSGRKIAGALAKKEKVLAKLAKRLDRAAFRYSTRWSVVVKASEASKRTRKAMRRAVSWGLGPLKIPFGRLFKSDNTVAILNFRRIKPYSQIKIDPGSRDVHSGRQQYDDSMSKGRRTVLQGDEAIRLQRNNLYSEAKHIDELADITKAKLGPGGKVTDPAKRRLLEIKLETQRMSAKIYRKIATELGDTHKWARRGVRIQDSFKIVKTIIKTTLLTTLWKTPQKGAKMRKPVILLRILGAVFAGTFAFSTYVEHFDRLRKYVGDEFALTLIFMIENEPGFELIWGFSLGDMFLEMFAGINKSAQQKVAAAGGDVQAANLDWDELGVWNNVQKNYSKGFKPGSGLPMGPSLKDQLHLMMGDPEAQQPPGDWLHENKDFKSLKIVLG